MRRARTRTGHTARCAAALALLALPAPAVGAARDYAKPAYNVLPPGESGSIPPSEHSTDQIPLYDGLTPLFDEVRPRHLPRFFKPNVFGTRGQGPTRVEPTPRGPAVRVVRDRWGVAHIRAKTRDDVSYAAGWVSAEDRSALMELLRGPARLIALDVPGVDPAALVESGARFRPSAATELFLSEQATALQQAGPRGRRILRDIDRYIDGINANYRARGRPHSPWTRNDVFAMIALLAGVFGSGGGGETARSELLDALQQRLGADRGWDVWDDLRAQYDPETDETLPSRFPYGRKIRGGGPGNAIVDDGSRTRTGTGLPLTGELPEPDLPVGASNALLVSAKRSRSGHPLFVAGPQMAYWYPEIVLEVDVHGGGIDARGIGVPGFPALVIGRGPDYAWSLTSAGSDIVDEYVETLCGNDVTYLYKGECRPMEVFHAGLLEGSPTDPTGIEVSFRSTVHGPVVAYATVDGRRVAISQKRSTRGREAVSGIAIAALMTNKVRSAGDFRRVMSRHFEHTFNAFYADDRDIAMISTGRLPLRPAGVDTGLPTIGDGRFEWQGFLSPEDHPQGTNPSGGVILNWNNKPARGFAAADTEWSYGSVVRNELFRAPIARRRRHTLTSTVRAMNRAATQDLRNDKVLPAIARVLRTGPAPSPRAQRMLELLRDWRREGSSRLDRDLDGSIDHPGAAIMDAAWKKISDTVMEPVLGPQLDQLANLNTRDNAPSSTGSAYNDGWYGYVDKDLRTLLADNGRGRRVRGRFHVRYCGNGDLDACRASLWTALEEAGAELAEEQGPNPEAWRANASEERIRFLPYLMDETMRWTNRPTFQQVIRFTGHRPRPGERRRAQGRRPPRLTG